MKSGGGPLAIALLAGAAALGLSGVGSRPAVGTSPGLAPTPAYPDLEAFPKVSDWTPHFELGTTRVLTVDPTTGVINPYLESARIAYAQQQAYGKFDPGGYMSPEAAAWTQKNLELWKSKGQL